MVHYTFDKSFSIRQISDKKKSKKGQNANLALAKYINIGYYLIAPLLIGVFFGLYLEKIFKSQGKIITIAILIGFVSTIYNLYRLTKE